MQLPLAGLGSKKLLRVVESILVTGLSGRCIPLFGSTTDAQCQPIRPPAFTATLLQEVATRVDPRLFTVHLDQAVLSSSKKS